jgi:hypothetical protein
MGVLFPIFQIASWNIKKGSKDSESRRFSVGQWALSFLFTVGLEILSAHANSMSRNAA